MLAFIVIAALLLDYVAGEPKRAHPLVGFGHCASKLENRFNQTPTSQYSIIIGLLCVMVLILPVALALLYLKKWATENWGVYALAIDILIVYWALGLRSLHQHMQPIQRALENADIQQARQLVNHVVSRDTASMEAAQITSAAIETTIENGADAVLCALFWYAVGGVFMVVAYRLVNTLDAMWGYRTPRFEYFGKAAAKLDDLLNYIPARLTALSYGLCSDLKGAFKSWRRDAQKLDSPNAGVVMAAGAGALNLRLGGDAVYHGTIKHKPQFGGSQEPVPHDISRALRLVNVSTVMWCGVLLAITLLNLSVQL